MSSSLSSRCPCSPRTTAGVRREPSCWPRWMSTWAAEWQRSSSLETSTSPLVREHNSPPVLLNNVLQLLRSVTLWCILLFRSLQWLWRSHQNSKNDGDQVRHEWQGNFLIHTGSEWTSSDIDNVFFYKRCFCLQFIQMFAQRHIYKCTSKCFSPSETGTLAFCSVGLCSLSLE